jgi:hypothetical protein
MKVIRTSLFLKVVVQHDEREKPEKLGAELCRQMAKNYMVRSAELSNYSAVDSGESDDNDS